VSRCRRQRTNRAAGLLIAVAGLVACGGGDDDADEGSSTSEIESDEASELADAAQPDTTSQHAPTTTAPPSSTAPTTSADLPTESAPGEPSVVIGKPVAADMLGYDVQIVPFGDGFVELRYTDGVVVVLASDDGASWREIESSPQLTGLPRAVSNGSRIVALVGDPVDPFAVPVPWVSDDGGVTWTALTLPPRDEPEHEFVVNAFLVGSFAVSSDRIVIMVQEDVRVDWAAYAREVLGDDHGQPGGERFDQNTNTITVSFADGFELTVDLDEAGLPPRSMPDSVTVLTHDGSGWVEPTELALTGPDLSIPQVVSGPVGFLYVNGSQAMISIDGVAWSRHAIPSVGTATIGAPLGHMVTAGRRGYLLIGYDALHHSQDGVDWTEVHRFERAAGSPDMGGAPPAINPSAGGAGFLVPTLDGLTAPPAATYLWSADGTTWTERSLDPSAQFFDSAVSDATGLVIPIASPIASMPTLPVADAELGSAIANAFFFEDISDPEGRVVLRSWAPQQEAECAGNGIFDALGADRVREINFGVFPFTMLGYGLSLPIEMDDATPIADTLRRCIADWEMLMITTATGGTQYISEESARCVQAAMDDDQAEEILAIELARPYDDQPSPSGPDLRHLDPMVAAFEGCLTDQELNAVDWS
jgi:hypothetical protein